MDGCDDMIPSGSNTKPPCDAYKELIFIYFRLAVEWVGIGWILLSGYFRACPVVG